MPGDVTKWMRDKTIEDKTMYQEHVVYEMRDEFGAEWIIKSSTIQQPWRIFVRIIMCLR